MKRNRTKEDSILDPLYDSINKLSGLELTLLYVGVAAGVWIILEKTKGFGLGSIMDESWNSAAYIDEGPFQEAWVGTPLASDQVFWNVTQQYGPKDWRRVQ